MNGNWLFATKGGQGKPLSLDHLRAKKTFLGKQMGNTAVSAIKGSSTTL